jgi:hypothetical protein
VTSPSNAKSDGAGDSIPDLYKLLSLSALESDHSQIERALMSLQKSLAKAQDPKQSQKISRIISLATKNLLDPQRKQIYDKAWVKVFGATQLVTASVAVEVSEPTWDLAELETHLPVEDPRAAFDLGQFFKTSASLPEQSTVEADFEKLCTILGGTCASEGAVFSSVRPIPPIQTEEMKRPSSNVTPILPPRKSPLTGAKSDPMAVAKQLRRQRSRSTLIAVLGMLVAVGVVFAVAFSLINNRQQVASSNRPPIIEQLPKNAASDLPAAQGVPNQQPLGSGLPKVPGIESLAANVGTEKLTEKPAEVADSVPDMNTPTQNTSPAPMPASETSAVVLESSLTDTERQAWSKIMAETRRQLGQHQFGPAKDSLKQAGSLAKTSLQREQHQRLSLVAVLVQEFYDYLRQAVSSLESAETITISGTTKVSFIEASDDQVAFRMPDGKNTSFKLMDIPIGLAYALVDLKMDIAHARSLARKAAFAAVHPRTNSSAIERAKQFWAQATADNVVPVGLEKFFDENYDLLPP